MIRGLWRRHRLLVILFVATLSLTVFLLVRLVVVTQYWSEAESRGQAIQGWMPIRYVANSWDVPPEILGEALGLEPEIGRRRTVAAIAEEQGLTIEETAAILRDAIADYRVVADPEMLNGGGRTTGDGHD